jgi:signal transduction histidine kinase
MNQAECGPEDKGRHLDRVPGTRRLELKQVRSRASLEREVHRLSARVEELERESAEVAHENAQLADFAAFAAHEVLKPLVMTEAVSTMLQERAGHGLDLETRRDIDALMRISSRMRLLVEALLIDARQTRQPLKRQPVDLGAVLDDCIDMLGAEIRERDVHLDIDPMPIVPGNAALLGGVFGNLLSNALKYGPREGGEIHVSVVRSEAGWTFTVDSEGPVIPEGERERIFEPWERGRGERRARGIGLGLAVVRRVVERHGGQVGVASPTGTGNRFFFTLPT